MGEELNLTIQNWLTKADSDLKTAEICLSSDEPTTDTICFHCQQAVEKYLKLYLLSKGNPPEKVHSIAVLLRECVANDNDFSGLAGIEYLTDYAVTVRYPDDFYMPSIEETATAFEHAKKVRSLVNGKLSSTD